MLRRSSGRAVLPAPAPFALANSLLVRCLSFGYRLTGKNRYDNYRLEHVHGAPILVIPSVFNPKLLRSGEFFASSWPARRAEARGTRCSIWARDRACALLLAARHAHRVVAVDINAAAVRCAHINVADEPARTSQSRCGRGICSHRWHDERFDLILFNPPFLRGTPRSDRDRAWRSNRCRRALRRAARRAICSPADAP